MSEQIQPPIVTQTADGWTLRTYSDGSWTKQRRVGPYLQTQCSWNQWLQETPEAVRKQDLAAMRQLGQELATQREKAFMDAFLDRFQAIEPGRGDKPDQPIVVQS